MDAFEIKKRRFKISRIFTYPRFIPVAQSKRAIVKNLAFEVQTENSARVNRITVTQRDRAPTTKPPKAVIKNALKKRKSLSLCHT